MGIPRMEDLSKSIFADSFKNRADFASDIATIENLYLSNGLHSGFWNSKPEARHISTFSLQDFCRQAGSLLPGTELSTLKICATCAPVPELKACEQEDQDQ
jgi:hypothetical protein